jgi:hypothetical protein|tara:strand:- start:501 stop:860 length:360 start_codon:yes stop_codon:yes gene_type:complete
MKTNEKVGIEQILEDIDNDVCVLFNKYIKKGFVSEKGELFFDDDDIVSRFNFHLMGLQRLIVDTYNIPYSIVPTEHIYDGETYLGSAFNFEGCYDDAKHNPNFAADMEAQDEKFGEHKI